MHELAGSELLGPYSPRNGDETEAEIDAILADPEIVLSSEDKAIASQFAHGLVNGTWGELRVAVTNPKTGEPITFGEVDRYETQASKVTIYPDHLLSRGNARRRQALRVDGLERSDWFKKLSRSVAAGDKYDTKKLSEIDTKGDQWQRAQLATRLTKARIDDARYVPPESMTIYFNPERLLQKAEGLQAYRHFYREVRRALRQQPSTDLSGVQHTMLDVHVAAVNSKLAMLYADLIDFKQQMGASGLVRDVGQWGARLAAVTPVFNNMPGELAKPVRPISSYARFIRRLDYIRNGVALQDGTITPLSPKTLALAKSIEDNRQEPKTETPELAFSPEELTAIKDTTWEPAQTKEFLETCLQTVGLLSTHQATWEEVKSREGMPADGLWQIVISPKATSITTNGRKRTMIIPDKARLLATDSTPVGVLGVSPHELAHVFQNEQKKILAQELPIIAAYGGRRRDTVHEMGGVLYEKQMQSLLGFDRPTGIIYLKGAMQLVEGGNKLQVARAMFDEIRSSRKTNPTRAERTSAANRTQRLFRKGGFDTQSLDYTEQDLILDSLSRYDPRTVKAIALGASSFALRDTAALHRVGMYEVPDPDNVPDPVELVLKVFRDKYLPELMAEHAERQAKAS